jgi:hypothetical protein
MRCHTNIGRKHLRIQRKSHLHTLFLCFLSSMNICNPPPSASKAAKFTKFDKEWARYGVFGLRGFCVRWWVNWNGLGFGALNIWLLHLYLQNAKEFCKALVGTPIEFLIIQNRLKWGKYGTRTKEGLEIFFQFFWSKLSFIIFSCFMLSSFIFKVEFFFVALQFAYQMTQKSLNLVKEWGKYWKVFGDGRF